MPLDSTYYNDIAMSIYGEPSIGANGDFIFVQESDTVVQDAMFRLKTVQGDWVLVPDCGASLESVIGSPNSSDTASKLEALVSYALTHDGLVNASSLQITTVPVNGSTILIIVVITYNGRRSTLSVSLDLVEGKLTVSAI